VSCPPPLREAAASLSGLWATIRAPPQSPIRRANARRSAGLVWRNPERIRRLSNALFPDLGMTERVADVAVTSQEDPILLALRDATIGDYEILAELGRGGMAVVYLAHDLALDRKVAIKVMFPALFAGEGIAERFKREARTAASLTHPNIIPIYAVKEHGSLLYFVMQFVGGRGLDSVIEERGQLPVAMVQAILNQVGEALEYAHRRGVVHRDIKPGNILVDEEGRAIVTDFGIAKVSAADSITRTGGVVGTPSYMSPEQCTAGEVTGASDQYSLGLVGYEMLTGSRPFIGESVMQLMYLRCTADPAPIPDTRPDCPRDLEQAVMRMLAREPERRWPTVAAAVTAVGSPSTGERAAVRKEMAELAKAGRSKRISMGIRTPTSPVPDTRRQVAAAAGDHSLDPSRRLPSWGAVLRWAVPALAVFAVAAWMLARGLDSAAPASTVVPVEDAAGPPSAPPVVASLELIPPSLTLQAGDASRLVARAVGAAGDPIPQATIELETSDPSIARLEANGMVTAVAAGSATITARSGNTLASALITVLAPPSPSAAPRGPAATASSAVRAIALAPLLDTLVVGTTRVFSAEPQTATGTPVAGRTVTWNSSNPAVADVSPGGMVTALGEGSTRITAESEGVSRGATLVVVPAPVATVEITPRAPTIPVGGSVTLMAVLRDTGGRELGDRAIAWSSDAPSIASVSPTGSVSGVAMGTARIAASSSGRAGQVTVTVTAGPSASAAPVEAPPTAEELRRGVERAILAFGRAIESRDIAELRRVYPGMTQAQEQAYAGLFRNVRRFTVALTVDRALDVQGSVARATGTARYHYFEPRDLERTFPYSAALEYVSGGWRLTSMLFAEE